MSPIHYPEFYCMMALYLFIVQTIKIIIYEDAPKKFSHFRCARSTMHFGDPWYLVVHFLNFKTPHIESHYETSRKVVGSFPDGVTGILQRQNPSSRTTALGSTQPSTEMSTRNTSWGGKGGRCLRLITLAPSYDDCLGILEPQPSGTLWGF